MNLYPAIDIRGGKVVRLQQGDYSNETVYGDDPAQVAQSFVSAGASWIHIVDLDAARTGEAVNRKVIARVASLVSHAARLQVGGGVRSVGDARELRDAGVARVVMGSAAVENPSLVDDVARVVPVAVGIDHRGGIVATHGWTEASTLTVERALSMFPSASAFVITDISRDGMLQGPDVDGLRFAVRSTATDIIASGGVGSLDHIRQLSTIEGLAGVITGKALYENKFSVVEALRELGEAPRGAS